MQSGWRTTARARQNANDDNWKQHSAWKIRFYGYEKFFSPRDEQHKHSSTHTFDCTCVRVQKFPFGSLSAAASRKVEQNFWTVWCGAEAAFLFCSLFVRIDQKKQIRIWAGSDSAAQLLDGVHAARVTSRASLSTETFQTEQYRSAEPTHLALMVASVYRLPAARHSPFN